MRKVLLLLTALLIMPSISFATDIFADQTGKKCEYCHAGTPGDLEFTFAGNAFIENYYKLPPWGLTVHHFIKKFHRFLISLHAVSSFALAGGLLFIGFTAPRLIEERDPTKLEKKFFTMSVIFSGGSGLLMLPMIIQQDAFLETKTGFLLSIKALVFLLMAGVTLYQFLVITKNSATLRESKGEEFENMVKNWELISTINIFLAFAVIMLASMVLRY